MIKNKSLSLTLAILAISCSVSFARHELIIAGASSPPYLFEDNGQIVGIDAEICKYIFNKMGVEYKIKILPKIRLIYELEKGRSDMGIGMSKKSEHEANVHYPEHFTRNAEFIALTNKKTKSQYDATSLAYMRDNNLKIGVIRGESYHEKLWALAHRQDSEKKRYHKLLDPVSNIELNLKKLNANRISVVLSEKQVGLYTAQKLGLKNIDHYDFIAFFKPIFNVFSKNSKYSGELYTDISSLMKKYDQILAEFSELPEFTEIYNWDWDRRTNYVPKTRKAKKDIVGKTVNIGFLAALSGPDSGWGKPGLTGNQIFIDEVNQRGGLLVGGVRHPLKMHVYDDEGNPEKALKGARELVEKHNVKFINGIGGASSDAIHPYLTGKKVIFASLISTDIKPDRPYLLAGGDVTPRIDMLRPWYHKNKNPNLTRWAVVSQDDPIGNACQAWEVGAAIAEGWEVVYDAHFPVDTSDFSNIVSDILATKPDVISLNLTWPDFVSSILEQLHIRGYEGEISGNYMDVEYNLTKVPEEFHENIVDSFPLFNDPFWGAPSVQHDFYNEWIKRFGPGAPEDAKRSITGIDWDHVIMLKIWAFGAQLAASFDPDEIIKGLRSQKSFPTILGNAVMAGKEMWGIQNMVSPPIPINETKNGVKYIQTIIRFEDWFDKNKDIIIDTVKSKGLFWEQQK